MDSAWAYKRRSRVKWAISFVVLIILATYLYTKMYSPPTCFDGKKNQDEQGTDCGGTCLLVCPFQAKDVSVEWTRLLEVSPGQWSAVAYVQNTNYDTYTHEAPYRFTLYDTASRAVAVREGKTFLGGEPSVAIVESKIESPNSEPVRVLFEWTAKPSFFRQERVRGLKVEKYEVGAISYGTEVRAVLINEQPVSVENVEVVVVVYDSAQNAIAASKTYVDMVSPRGTKNISFTWPGQFSSKPSRLEFIPRVPLLR